MANIIIPNRRIADQKPPAGSMIDWGHPLAQGLIGCYLMNEGGGNKVFNLACKFPKQDIGVFGSGSDAPVRGYGGINFLSQKITFGDVTFFDGKVALSCFAKFMVTAYTGTYNIFSNIARKDGCFNALQFSGTGTILQTALWTGAAAKVSYGTWPGNVPLNRDVSAGMSWKVGVNGSVPMLFRDRGIYLPCDALHGIACAGPTDNCANAFVMGEHESSGSETFRGRIYCIYFWERFVTPQEHSDLSTSPYQFIRYAPRRIYFTPASGGGTSATATPSKASASVVANIPLAWVSKSSLKDKVGNCKVSILLNSPTILITRNSIVIASAISIKISVGTVSTGSTRSATATPSIKVVTVSTNAPTIKVSASRAVTVTIAGLTIVINQPTVSAGTASGLSVVILLKSYFDKSPVIKSRIEKYFKDDSRFDDAPVFKSRIKKEILSISKVRE